MPKFVFKRLRSAEASNPNPVHISARGVMQSSYQQRKLLLCSDCDGVRFGASERVLSRLCLQADGTFPLRDAVVSCPEKGDGDTAVYFTADNAAVQHWHLVYFAASMVWRTQFADKVGKQIRLGAYDASFRDFLLGVTSFPRDVSLMVMLRHRSNITQLSHDVITYKVPEARGFQFAIPGLQFTMIVGKRQPELFRLGSFATTFGSPVIDSDIVDRQLSDKMTRVVGSLLQEGKPWRVTHPSLPHHLLRR